MLELLRTPFRWLFLSTLVSQAGSKMGRIALLVATYLLTHQALLVSLVVSSQLIASIVFGPLLAPWVDRQDRRRLMVATDLGRALLTFLIPLIGFRSELALLLLVFAIEALTSAFYPASQAAIPEVAGERLDEANSLSLFADRTAEVAFTGLAGLLIALLGSAPVFYINGLTYLASAVFLAQLPALRPASPAPEHTFSEAFRDGLRFLWQQKLLRSVILILTLAACFGSIEGVLNVVLAIHYLHVGSTGFGLMEAAVAIGVIGSTLILPQLLRNRSRLWLFGRGLLGLGLSTASIGTFPYFFWVLPALLIGGFFNMAFIIPTRSLLQLHTPPELRGRVFASFSTLTSAGVLVGSLLAGWLQPLLGAPAIYILAGLAVALLGGGILRNAQQA
jgi:MFS family permease